MGGSGVAKRVHIHTSNVAGEDLGVGSPPVEGGIDERLRRGGEQALRQRLRLGQQRPWPVPQSESGIGPIQRLTGRYDVKYRQPVDPLPVVECQPIRDPATAVMTNDRESIEAKTLHQRHHVARHRRLRIRRVVRSARRGSTRSVATKVSAHDRELLGERRGDAAPHDVCLGKAVK
jgi:hypothetical protein